MDETCDWAGYKFYVHDPDNTEWYAVGGIYIFAGIARFSPQDSTWGAYYIGSTKDFSDRLPNHEKWAKAHRLGATHVHSMRESDVHRRREIERDLIDEFDPPVNRQHR